MLVLVFSLGPVSGGVSAATTLWVAPDGNDDSPGTKDRPFATVARAFAAISQQTGGGSDDIEVILRGGLYPLGEPLVLTPSDQGGDKRSVSVVAYDGERAVLTGSRQLGGKWEKREGNLWVLPIPESVGGKWIFRSLFSRGKSLSRAREPDAGFWTVATVDRDRRKLTLKEKWPVAWDGLSGVELNTTAFWHFNRQPVASIASDGIVAARAVGTEASSARFGVKSHSRVWLENALAFADIPGEWFLDTAAGRLYYQAAADEDPNQMVFTAPVMRELIVVRGTADHGIRNVHFRGLEFAETDWEMPEGGRLGVQAGAWAFDRSRTFSPGAALRFVYALNTSVEACTFRDLGDGAISYEKGCHQGEVRACSFTRVGSDVIQIGRMPDYAGDKHPLHRDFARSDEWLAPLDAFPGSQAIWQRSAKIVQEAPSGFKIEDNTILDCCHLDFGGVGIWVGYANHVRIEHNFLRGLPYTGISVGWRWAPGLTNCHSNTIAWNRVESVMQEVGDGAGIYLAGEQPGTRVVNNFVRDSGRNYWSHGLYVDECSDHMELSGNYAVQVMSHSIFMNKNGRNQLLECNNGETGTTVFSGNNGAGEAWVDFKPERVPADLTAYGPRVSINQKEPNHGSVK